MKKTFVLFVALCALTASFAQTTPPKKLPSIGIGFFLKDYITPEQVSNTSVSKVLSNKTYGEAGNMAPGIQFSYFQGITSHIDIMGQLGGCFTKYSYKGKKYSANDGFLVEGGIHANLKLLTDKALINPYLTAGLLGAAYNAEHFMAYAPVGGGFAVNLGDGTFIYLQSTLQYKISNDTKENLNYAIGLVSPIYRKKEIKKPTPPPPPVVVAEIDTDLDGITDRKDKCPNEAGLAKYDGCPIPDTDKDGINDENDKCPNLAGVEKYNGCPIPDTDKDGINDEEDKCPNEMGLARLGGCPIVDTDKDGVYDEDDKCPTVAGVKENAGCPEIQTKMNELAKRIYFKSGATTIEGVALKPLDEVAAILAKYPATKLIIEGHTDNVGNAANNKKLSQKRADAIKAYFIKKGIIADRLEAAGYGSEKPIADNKKEAGRTQNRRVELKATY